MLASVYSYREANSEKYNLLLCAWKTGYLKSSHIYGFMVVFVYGVIDFVVCSYSFVTVVVLP